MSLRKRRDTRSRPTLAPAALDRILAVIERSGLSATDLRLLVALADHSSSVPGLAQELTISQRAVRASARNLEMRGLVGRQAAGPGRRSRLTLTPSGLATLRPMATAAEPEPEPFESPSAPYEHGDALPAPVV